MSFPYERPRRWGLSWIDPLARELKCKPNEVEARLMVKLPQSRHQSQGERNQPNSDWTEVVMQDVALLKWIPILRCIWTVDTEK